MGGRREHLGQGGHPLLAVGGAGGAGGLSGSFISSEVSLGFCFFCIIWLVSRTEGESSEDVDGEEASMTEIFGELQHCLSLSLSEGKRHFAFQYI